MSARPVVDVDRRAALDATEVPAAAERAYDLLFSESNHGNLATPTFRGFASFARTVRSSKPVAPHAHPEVLRPGTNRLADGIECPQPEAVQALGSLAAHLRAIGYDGSHRDGAGAADACRRFGAGLAAPHAPIDDVLGEGTIDALVNGGLAELGEPDPSFVRLTLTVFPAGPTLSVLPRLVPGRDHLYLGPDSLALLRHVWIDGGRGHRAADLGTGNGFLAAALATRFDHVVGTDLSARCVATASLLHVLNPTLASRIALVRTDVAAGLEPGVFDLVTANTPWVPETIGFRGPGRRFAAGGPIGYELPRRFVDAAVSLLAPGGRAFVSCLDLELQDGRRPLRDHAAELQRTGFTVEIRRSGMRGGDDMRAWARHLVDGLRRGYHSIAVIRRL